MKNKNFLIYFTVTVIFFFTLFIMKYINDTRNDYQAISEKYYMNKHQPFLIIL